MKEPASVVALVETEFHSKRVLVVGDVMLDRYVSGNVDRISPEAPVPVLRFLQTTSMPGGAGNVAMNLAGLGAQVALAGFWGNDAERTELARSFESSGIDVAGMVTSTHPTISKTRVVARQQQLLRMDVESDEPPSDEERAALQERVLDQISEVDAVILSDYAKGALGFELCGAVIGRARAGGISAFVDPKERSFQKYAGATTACPNLAEFSVTTGLRRPSVSELVVAGQSLLRETGMAFLTVTMSERGILGICPDGSYHSPARAREVFDVSGAGDTVIAVLALSMASGAGFEASIDLANLAAGIVVAKAGTAPISRRELLVELRAELGREAQPPASYRAESA